MKTQGNLLSISGLKKNFGGLWAVNGISLEVKEGELLGLIGPNGSGKTTLFNLLTGIYEPTEGSIKLGDRELARLPAWQITRQGIARTFQNIRLFSELTVLDNVKISFHKSASHRVISSLFRLRSHYEGEEKIQAESLEMLKLFSLADKACEMAKNLSYGEQRRLEMARAMALRPQLLLLDEPAAGMNPQETGQLTSVIRDLRDRFGIAILLIEHDMSLVMKLCERIYVMDYGQVIAHGLPEEVRKNPVVIEAYLGGEVHHT